MNSKLPLVIAGLGIAFVAAYFSIDKEKEPEQLKTNEIIKEEIQKTEETPKKSKGIEILYLDENKNKKEEVKVPKVENKTSNDQTGSNYVDIEKYVEENNLKEITFKSNQDEDSRFKIYAEKTMDEIKEENPMLPPAAPSLVTGTFSSGQVYTVAVPSEIKAYTIIDSDTGEKVEVSPEKDSSSVSTNTVEAPPSIPSLK